MPLPTVRIESDTIEAVHSPFSGGPVESHDAELDESDPTILFAYHGDAGLWWYVSDDVRARLAEAGEDAEELGPEELVERLDIKGGFAIEMDTGWTGVNWYGFAPAQR